jgi:POT family proton-dependent oligopeptide transporter
MRLAITLMALSAVAVGNGFFKPNIATIVGRSMPMAISGAMRVSAFSTWASTLDRGWGKWPVRSWPTISAGGRAGLGGGGDADRMGDDALQPAQPCGLGEPPVVAGAIRRCGSIRRHCWRFRPAISFSPI